MFKQTDFQVNKNNDSLSIPEKINWDLRKHQDFSTFHTFSMTESIQSQEKKKKSQAQISAYNTE